MRSGFCLRFSASALVIFSSLLAGICVASAASPLLTISKRMQDRVALKAGRYIIAVNEGAGWQNFHTQFLEPKKRYRVIYPYYFNSTTNPHEVEAAEFEDASYSKPEPGTCVIHLMNELTRIDAVQFKILDAPPASTKATIDGTDSKTTDSKTGSAGKTTSMPKKGSSPFDGTWHTRRVHNGCCSYSASEDFVFSTGADGVTTTTAGSIPFRGTVSGTSFNATYGSGGSGSMTLSTSGNSFTGSFKDVSAHHQGSFSGNR